MSKKPISEYPVHPAAEVFPLMTEQVYAEFKEDIRLHGQREKIIVRGKELIDGRHRLRACLELGIEPVWSELPKTEDPIAWIVSHNRHRRHETTAQRALVAAKLAPLILGANQHKKEGSSINLLSQGEAAKQLNVSTTSVKRARKVLNTASADVIAEVEAGKLSLNAAVSTTTKASEAEKKAKADAKAAKDKAKADAQVARENAKAEKAAEKAKQESAKANEKAEKEARIAASRTPEGQITNIKSLINQHIGKLVRYLADLHRLKPNRVAFDKNKKACAEIKTW